MEIGAKIDNIIQGLEVYDVGSKDLVNLFDTITRELRKNEETMANPRKHVKEVILNVLNEFIN